MSATSISWGMNIPRSYSKIEEGNYVARIVKMIDLGTHIIKPYKEFDENGKKNEPTIDKLVLFQFEFPTENRFEDKDKFEPHLLSKEVKVALSKKESKNKTTLTELFQIFKIEIDLLNFIPDHFLGKTLQAKVGFTSKDKPKVVSFSKLSKEQEHLIKTDPDRYKNFYEIEALYLDPEYFDFEVFKKQPKWVQDKIKLSKEWEANNWQELEDDYNSKEEDEDNTFEVPF